MTRRFVTKIGDIFSIQISDNEKRFFQLIAFDLTQLNSDVIRCFNRVYPLEANPEIETIITDQILFYSHCTTKLGLKMDVWTKIGKSYDIGNLKEIIFRCTNDYGRKEGDPPILFSSNWYVWQIGDENFTNVGKLEGKNKNSYIGLVINPIGILELAKGNKYPLYYPDYE
jgi:hypothetical protein